MAIFKRLLRDRNGDIVIPATSVSGDYYTATRVSTGQYSITSPFLPEPTDGMSIKVKFDYASTSGTPALSINGGTYNYIMTIGATTGTAASRTGAILNVSTIYEMTYNSSYGWIINNVHTDGEYIKYSTSETAVGEWIDGKKLYKKTLQITNVPIGEYDFYHGISGLKLIVKYEGFCKINDTTTLQVPTIATSTVNSFSIWTTYSDRIKIFSTISMDLFYCTIYYTKT